MISINEKIAFTHDDPWLSECSKLMTSEDGWKRSEDTVAVVFERTRVFSIGVPVKEKEDVVQDM